MGSLKVRRATDPGQSKPQLFYDDVSNSVRGIGNGSDFYFIAHNASVSGTAICPPISYVEATTSRRVTMPPVTVATSLSNAATKPFLPDTTSSGAVFGTGDVKGGSSVAAGNNVATTSRHSESVNHPPDLAVYIVPAVATVVLATSITVICVAMRRKRRVASAVVVLLALMTGGAVAPSQWTRVPSDTRAMQLSDIAIDATLIIPMDWKVKLFVTNVNIVNVDVGALISSSEPPLNPPAPDATDTHPGFTFSTAATTTIMLASNDGVGAGGTTGGSTTSTDERTVQTDRGGGAGPLESDNGDVAAMMVASPSSDLTSIIVYSISGVLMFLSALFAIGVWAWMRRPAKEQVVRLDTPMTATPPLTSSKSSMGALSFNDALSLRAETEYSKAPSPRAHQLGYDAVPAQEYVPAPPASDVALPSSADNSGYTRPPARYDSVASGTVSMPTSNNSSQYTRPGVDRRAFASGEIDFATPDEDASVPEAAPPAMRTVEWSSIVLGERIGAGSYGEVFTATLDGETVAVKKLLDEAGTKEFERETKLMSVLPPHRNVLRVYAAAYDPPAIVSELCELGSLDQHQRLTQRKLLVVARDIADGMAHLHAHSIVHRDLAARNLLVNSKRIVKVADFGLARITNEDTYASTVDASAGPAKWMAPETIEKGKFSPAGDVWSFGVVLWELATGKRPFADMTAAAAAVAIAKGERLPRPADISDEMWSLMQSCWHTDSHKRPSMAQIVAQLAQMLTNVARKT